MILFDRSRKCEGLTTSHEISTLSSLVQGPSFLLGIYGKHNDDLPPLIKYWKWTLCVTPLQWYY